MKHVVSIDLQRYKQAESTNNPAYVIVTQPDYDAIFILKDWQYLYSLRNPRLHSYMAFLLLSLTRGLVGMIFLVFKHACWWKHMP